MTAGLQPYAPRRTAHARAALFAAAVLSRQRELSYTTRSLVISNVRDFDIHDPARRLNGLSEAFASSGVRIQRFPRAQSLRRAANRAEDWFNQGIYILFASSLTVPLEKEAENVRVVFAKGNRDVLDIPAAAVLNSRKPRGVSPADKWLIATKHLVEYALENHMAVVSSYGNLAYSIVSCLAKGSPLLVVCDGVLPFMASEERRTQFQSDYRDLFQPKDTLFLSSFPPGPLPPRSVRCVERDAIVAGLASKLLVAEIRAGGNMEKLLTTARVRGSDIFGVEIGPKRSITVGPISVSPITVEGKSAANATTEKTGRAFRRRSNRLTNSRARLTLDAQSKKPIGWEESLDTRLGKHIGTRMLTALNVDAAAGCLVHYTRSCPGPWPGQTIAEYCRSLIEGRADAGHSGFDTLNRILREGVIRGSNRMTRGMTRVVSFTECLPHDLAHLIKWRTGLARWTFEPYGIAIRSDVLMKLGASQVIYGEEELYKALPEEERHRFQMINPACGDWSEEREWRLKGNLDLETVKAKNMVVLVRTMQEATAIEDEFALAVIPLTA